MSKIGIVTVTFNSELVLPDFLDSLKIQSYKNFILYIVDNDSSDQGVPNLKKTDVPFEVVYLLNDENLGVAEGNNIGIHKALEDKCEYVMLINNDVVFEAGLFQKLLDGIEQSKAAVCVPKMNYFEPKTHIWFAGGYFKHIRLLKPDHVDMMKTEKPENRKDKFITYAPTCCALFTAETFETIGIMDAAYFVYWDDTDFFIRLWKAKLQVFYIGNTEFYHKVGSLTKGKTNNKFHDFMVRYYNRNYVYFLRKHTGMLFPFYFVAMYFYTLFLFAFNGKYDRNFKTLRLIHKSMKEGFKMKRP